MTPPTIGVTSRAELQPTTLDRSFCSFALTLCERRARSSRRRKNPATRPGSCSVARNTMKTCAAVYTTKAVVAATQGPAKRLSSQNTGPNVRSSKTTSVRTVATHHSATCHRRTGVASSIDADSAGFTVDTVATSHGAAVHLEPAAGDDGAIHRGASSSAYPWIKSSITRSFVLGTLDIRVVGATGAGSTALSAFDASLNAAGVCNFNLVRLSSVIPPGSTVTADQARRVDGRWGDRLYAVWAFQSAERLGEEAWAGVCWVQDPSDGRGLFVEHEGSSEAQVRQELKASMEDLCRTRGLDLLEQHSVVVGRRCEGPPVGALVLAPYQVERW